ncbi:MAG: hypothetical protein WC900_06440 [Oscillospiraceae bacterium]|jgi:hypothetical protein
MTKKERVFRTRITQLQYEIEDHEYDLIRKKEELRSIESLIEHSKRELARYKVGLSEMGVKV